MLYEVITVVREAYREATRKKPEEPPREGPSTAREVLENGIRVVVREDRSVPVVAVEAGFLAGVRAEPPGKGGLSTITAELLTKGTRVITSYSIHYTKLYETVDWSRVPSSIPMVPGDRVGDNGFFLLRPGNKKWLPAIEDRIL